MAHQGGDSSTSGGVMSQSSYSGESLRNFSWSLLHKGRWAQADVYLIPFNGRLAVVKDYRSRRRLIRFMARVILIEREIAIYKRLEGILGVPEVYGKLGKYDFILEYKEGKTLSKFQPGQLPAQFFDQLEGIIGQMHQRGVVHCDIRRKNVLVSSEYMPWVIDFNTGFYKKKGYNLINRLFFPIFCRLDRQAFLKLKSSLASQLITDKERVCLEKEIFLHQLGRWLRKRVYRKVKRQWKKRNSLCPPAIHAWEKGYTSDPYNILLNLVRGLMLRGYILEKIIKIGMSLNINHGVIIRDEKGLIDYIKACYRQVLGEYKEKTCADYFCLFLKEQAFCKRELCHCGWRESFQDSFRPIRDDY